MPVPEVLIQNSLWAGLLLVVCYLGWRLIRALLGEKQQQLRLVDRINQVLPQTQCGRCGYEGCLPYARAMARGEAINKCPPGGNATIIRLAELLGEMPRPLDPAHGPLAPPKLAFIREDECIGCTKCIQACPVDAILGAPKLMHTVIESECTGCDLCIDPCPVDCIDLVDPTYTGERQWRLPRETPNAHSDLEILCRL